MADPEHFKILKQGVESWNEWRKENPAILPNLINANLRGANLRGANLSDAMLSEADLSLANLRGANLIVADLSMADLSVADLRGANLSVANLRQANLSEANLSDAMLSEADLSEADLSVADLSVAVIDKANLSHTIFGYTKIGDIDLSSVSGLENTIHIGPSTIGIDTIFRSAGKIPYKFLEDAGVPDIFIEYMASLTGQTFQYYSCFISHSTNDKEFADRIYADLRNEGVRCWFAPEDMKIGDKILDSIDRSIRIRDKLLLILSEESIGSEWVEDEVNTAFEEERKRKTIVLFPIRLDNSVMDTDEAWAAKLRNRHIGDFTNWKNHNDYLAAFKRLLRDLQIKKNEEKTS
jgi:uncharacterized protein YjbI with pentapeptide repeats